MYYKRYPQAQGQFKRAPLPPGYATGYAPSGANKMYGTTLDTVTSYFSNPWVIMIGVIIIVLIIVWLMSSNNKRY